MADNSNGVNHNANGVESATEYTTDKKGAYDNGAINVAPAYSNDPGADPEKHGHYVEHAHGTGTLEPVYNEHGEIEGGTQRLLKQRHMAMIAIGGAIGTGLFVGSGSALASGGPVALWIGYCLMATMVYAMMVALGEMATLFPVAGAFTHYASRFVDESLGFAMGFNYWYSWAITLPTELSAAAIVISYWDDNTSHTAAYITVCLVMVWVINLFGARAYGEAEFWFSTIKVVTIIGLIILSLVLMCGGGPTHDAIGFRYWRNPGPFNHLAAGDGYIPGAWGEFLAFWSVFVQAAFSFIGTEIIGVTVGEASNPRKTVPKAIKRVFFRLVVFYVLGIFFISVLVPYNDPRLLNAKSGTAAASPWVIAIENAQIKVLPSIVNAVILISAWSAGNSDLYAASRTMYALALEGKMPKIFRRCTKGGLPIYCVCVTGIFGVLAYLSCGNGNAQTAFDWLYNLSAITGLLTWWTILLSYLRFYYGLKAQGISRDSFPFRAPWQPWLSWYGIIWFSLIVFFNGFTVFVKGNWDVSSFIAAYITVPIFFGAWIIWKVVKRTRFIPLKEIDFTSGRRELDEMEELDNVRYKPDTMWKKILSTVF
ncbi:uncharacterized protein EHS24_008538 [Apiotrichum porosum]|uniref:Amino acid permease/ SLC12A domain-containing protein n=1 Tax=Apiotrichum porosum TaxID=105984 RepID=A0A427XQG3_9TREE|nr:uncharacterized protein EHS24_008538 [Apiotrichum porosum]RSH81104.1 hypothetical protein EHS24_008538 [Apiotrichum porosum]